MAKQTHDLIELNDKLQNQAQQASKERDEARKAKDEAIQSRDAALKAGADAQAEVVALKKAQAERESHASSTDAELANLKKQVSHVLLPSPLDVEKSVDLVFCGLQLADANSKLEEATKNLTQPT
jgi:chromosome segregation ATPase